MKNRNYCLTIFDLEKLKGFKPDKTLMKYLALGPIEKAPKTGKRHIHGYIELLKPTRVNRVKKLFNDKTLHVEKRRGSQTQAIKYCFKELNEGDRPFEWGKLSKQGNRTDLENVANSIMKNKGLFSTSLEYPVTYIKYSKGMKELSRQVTKKNSQKWRAVNVEVYWGETGTGKTRKAMDENEDIFKLDKSNNLWWDGYEQEKCLLIDDFYGWISIGTMLNVLDGYKLRLEIKGSFTYANWDKVIITSNSHPKDWYTNVPEKALKALFRRINKIHEMK